MYRKLLPVLVAMVPLTAAPICLQCPPTRSAHVVEQGPTYFLTGVSYEIRDEKFNFMFNPPITDILIDGPLGRRTFTASAGGFWDVIQSTALIGEVFVAVFEGTGDIQDIFVAHYNGGTCEFPSLRWGTPGCPAQQLPKPQGATHILFTSYDKSQGILWADVLFQGVQGRSQVPFALDYVQAIPEPATVWFLAAGLAGIALARVRK